MSKKSRTLTMAVACVNASGVPVVNVCTVAVTGQQYRLGEHYDKARAKCEENGYEGPFVAFDPMEFRYLVSGATKVVKKATRIHKEIEWCQIQEAGT